MESRYGFPIVNAGNIFQVIDELGIKKWGSIKPSQDLKAYEAGDLSLEEKEELVRFAPKAEVVFLDNPKGGIFRGYRTVMKNWATVFALLDDDLIPVIVEFKHGSEDICIVPPSGVPSIKDFDTPDPMSKCAKREFWEETGIELESLMPLSGATGNAVTPRQSTQRYFPYLGIPKQPIVQTRQNLDKTELLKILLIPLPEWLRLISEKKIVDECAITCTFLALQTLGRIQAV